jgi:ABC-type transporter Mla subunit MlaD
MSKKEKKNKKEHEESIVDKFKEELKKHVKPGEFDKAFDTLAAFLGKDSKETKKMKDVKKKATKLVKSLEETARELEKKGNKVAKELNELLEDSK